MRDPAAICQTESNSGVFLVLSIIFLLYLTLDIALASVAILRTRPTVSPRF